MSADDQQFLDVLSSLPTEVQRYSHEVADYINQNVDKIASVIREQVSSSPWIPDSIRSRVPPPTPPPAAVPAGALSTLERVQDWISRHKIATGVIVLVSGTVAYKVYRKSKLGRKSRRARRARNGGRVEVVVIAGSPTLPLTRSLSLDMERKGFIVYVVCSSMEDEVMVQNLSRPDIKPLAIDITDTPNAGAAIDRFAQFLQSPHSAVPGAKRNFLTLKSVILIPSLNYQTSPIALIPPSNFADLFNTHLLHPILTIQAFLPLLTSRVGSSGDKSPPKVLVFTPSIISSINPPFHAPEATVCSALSAFTEVLTAELRPLAIPVTHIQLGTFDFTGFTPAGGNSRANQLELLPAPESAEVLGWPEPARHVYGRNFAVHTTSAISSGRIRGARGSALRDLHSAVFDVIDGSNTNSVIRIGLGANIYGFVGRWVPRGLVAWMMGIRKVDELQSWQSDPEHSPRSGSDSGEGQEYVTVPAEELRQSWSERR